MTRVCGQLGHGEQNLRSDRLSPGPSLGLLTLQAGGVAIDQEADQGILFIHRSVNLSGALAATAFCRQKKSCQTIAAAPDMPGRLCKFPSSWSRQSRKGVQQFLGRRSLFACRPKELTFLQSCDYWDGNECRTAGG